MTITPVKWIVFFFQWTLYCPSRQRPRRRWEITCFGRVFRDSNKGTNIKIDFRTVTIEENRASFTHKWQIFAKLSTCFKARSCETPSSIYWKKEKPFDPFARHSEVIIVRETRDLLILSAMTVSAITTWHSCYSFLSSEQSKVWLAPKTSAISSRPTVLSSRRTLGVIRRVPSQRVGRIGWLSSIVEYSTLFSFLFCRRISRNQRAIAHSDKATRRRDVTPRVRKRIGRISRDAASPECTRRSTIARSPVRRPIRPRRCPTTTDSALYALRRGPLCTMGLASRGVREQRALPTQPPAKSIDQWLLERVRNYRSWRTLPLSPRSHRSPRTTSATVEGERSRTLLAAASPPPTPPALLLPSSPVASERPCNTRPTHCELRARIRASSNLAESFLSHDLSPSSVRRW